MKKAIPREDGPEKAGRRGFLKQVWKILGFFAAAEVGVFTFSLLKPTREINKSSPQSTMKILGNVEDFPVNSVTPDRINKVYIIRQQDGGFLAMTLTCSHLGCSVAWDELSNQFICPCHSSSFDRNGSVLSSPAPRPLDYFPVTIEAGKVKIDISRKTKRRKFEKSQLTYAI